ncbi:hypothetical protein PIB30_092045, partial [Stylosanthes scabra]|nr:hypothetical protein [Stylosanthes scabra]
RILKSVVGCHSSKPNHKNLACIMVYIQELPLVSIGHVWTKLQHGPNVILIGSKGSSTLSLSHVGVTFWPSQNVKLTQGRASSRVGHVKTWSKRELCKGSPSLASTPSSHVWTTPQHGPNVTHA